MNTSKITRARSTLLLVGVSISLCASFFAAYVHAQVGLPGIENALSIRIEPTNPAPEDAVRLTVQSSVIDLSQAEIVWRSRGKILATGTGVDAAGITVGALGTRTDVDVSVMAPDGVAASAHAAIIPTELDLLVDSDAYVPPFYRGRARASAGTSIRLEAIPHFELPGGSSVTNANIIFTWRRNNAVIGSASGRGKASAVIPVEHLFGSDTISVEARTADGLLSNVASFSLAPTEPVLLLYPDHPLFGIMYHQALGPTTLFPESEMTFAAVPYFAQAGSPHDPALRFDWRVNGKDIPQGTTDPALITINADNSSGIALLQLELTHATNFFLDVRGAWNVTFSSGPPTREQFGGFGQ